MEFNKENLLIVEDHKDTLNSMYDFFKFIFNKVYLAEDGLEALEIYNNNSIDVIVSDINLPKLNGLDLIKEIRKDNLSIPIIIVSAQFNTDVLFKASNSNIQAYLRKPIMIDEIKKALKTITDYRNLNIENKKQNLTKINNSIYFNKHNHYILVDNIKIELTKKECELLSLLLMNKNQIVYYQKIEQELWLNHGNSMSEYSLRTLIKKIRKKLKYEVLENIPKVGYKINC